MSEFDRSFPGGEVFRLPVNPEAEQAAATALEGLAEVIEEIKDPLFKAQVAGSLRMQFPEFIKPIIEDAQAEIIAVDKHYQPRVPGTDN